MTTEVNPDPHVKGYRFSPLHRVTAIFRSRDHLDAVLQALHAAGFPDQAIEVFVGEAGAERLDLSGKHHGVVVRFLRTLEWLFADETELFQQIDHALRNGGMVLDVFTRGLEEKKQRAAEILKAHDAHEVYYWGRWAIERLGV
jgi:hypothetical protein